VKKKGPNFIEQIIDGDLTRGFNESDLRFRFPPEPNGHLHIGHLKAICLNFNLGEKYKANGADIEITVKKGWHHGFTANYKEEYEGDNATFNNCPGAFTNDEGIIIYDGNSSYPDCIKWGAKIGGNKGVVFKKPFLKFFTESLLN